MRLGRRGFLGGAAVLPLAACVPGEAPVAEVGGQDDDGYNGTGLTGGFPMPDIELTDQFGESYSLATTPTTKALALFFGYTNCPDVCPGILADMATARRRLEGELGDEITLVMVTTDPARDDPETLRTYLERIDEDFVGLTGDLDVIVGIAGDMGIPVAEGKQLPSGGYEVDHGSQVLGVGADRLVQVVWTGGQSIGELREDYATLISRQP
ncbi:SCO family protein [Tessaracoccus sp. OS52]|uniref:SCO family protein n=1 Tax=Tessaracoccus sp. OS52 TaxID=2886691 RepID=UPI001D1209D7|nr:SCO family protein [Tessaracoccus sp. OS52]